MIVSVLALDSIYHNYMVRAL